MQIIPTLRNRLIAAAIVAAVIVAVPVHANATSKEIIELQTEMQQLLEMVQRVQSTLDSRISVLQHTAEQTADNANQMTRIVNALQQRVATESSATNGKIDTVSGQVQSLNDSIDELKTRIVKLQSTVQSLQKQLQNIQSPPAATTTPGASGASATPGAAPGTTPGASPGAASGSSPGAASGSSPGAASGTTPGAEPTSAAAQMPPLKQTFQAAVRDYNAARYDVATGEFKDVIRYYPLDNLAGQANYYLGEIAYRHHHYDDAVNYYNAVIEGFAGSARAPAARLHKGFALLLLKRRTEGIRELRSLIVRYPRAPEAAQARYKLKELGVRISSRR